MGGAALRPAAKAAPGVAQEARIVARQYRSGDRRDFRTRKLMDRDWYQITNVAVVPTPALVIYPERVRENIRRAIAIARDPQRLRPHIKTHKCAEIVKMHL